MFHIIRNFIDYPLRQFFHWRREGLIHTNELKDELFNHLPEPEQTITKINANRLLEEYHLQSLYSSSSKQEYCINLYYIDMLEKSLDGIPCDFPENMIAVDIGCSDWFYVHGLYSFFRWWRSSNGRNIKLYGYELDAYRLYSDLFSRYDHAISNIGDLHEVCFIDKEFIEQLGRFHFLCIFFPFVFYIDHLRWGLPPNKFNPQYFIQQCWNSIKPGGILVLVNQGEKEHKVQMEILCKANIPIIKTFHQECYFFTYKNPHYVIVSIK